ncbi:hypothetical protein GO308_12900 [Sphingomonas sp. SFZ2018-12]|uniref:hypothetical protein n=1 Tax=Sphingomonas sp. SFZ2018-12 TaxID=2683197 RepID=UPI001F0FD88A|nr:hypothetical protein [Sphingomonas sp. SFZ2018-12]MCH4894014.1 hypothetical protein [Sphingomonas sp. SFZ2018-12]
MSKVLRIIGAVASVVALIPSPIQPIAAAVATVANIGAALTAKKPVSRAQGSQTSFKIDPGGPLPYVIGRTSVGGTMAYRRTYGPDNLYKTYVTVLGAGGPYDAIEAFQADRVTVSFNANSDAVGYYYDSKEGHAHIWHRASVGATPATALTNPAGRPGPKGSVPALPGWSSAHRMSGYASAMHTLAFNVKGKRFQSGEPAPSWIVRGAKVYDPRLDSTYPGGSGPCRWADPSNAAAHAAARATWVYSELPALHELMWALGIWQRDETNPAATYRKILGIGARIEEIDVASYVTAANVQQANGWKVGGEVRSNMSRWEVLKLIAEAGCSEPVPGAARLATMVQQPRVPIGTVTGDDLAGPVRNLAGIRPRRERLNGYRARIRSEAHGWEMTPLAVVQIPEYVAADGRESTGSGDFALVQQADQGATIAAYKVFDSRELQPISLPLKPQFGVFRVGDCLTLNIPEVGLVDQDAIVRGKSTNPRDGVVTLTFRTETAGKHAFALGQSGVVPPAPTLGIEDEEPAAPLATEWNATGGVRVDAGYREPAIFVTGGIGNANADAVVFEVRKVGTTTWTMPSIDPVETVTKVILGLDSAADYEVAVSYRVRGVIGLRLVLGPVTTGAPPNAVYADGTPIDDVRADLIGRLEAVEAGIPGLSAELQAIGEDGILSIDEKIKRLIPLSSELEGTWTILDNQAAAVPGTVTTVATARSNAATARTNWLNYRNGLSPAWNDTSTQTAIDRATYDSLINAYTQSLTALSQALRNDAATRADWANVTGKDAVVAQIDASTAELARIASDGWLTRVEKPAVRREYESLVKRFNGLIDQFDSQGSPADAIAARDAAAAAIYALPGAPNSIGTYLESLTPPYTDLTQDTPVDASIYNARWSAAYTAIEAFHAALVGSVYQDLESAISAAGGLGDDGILSAYEKSTILLPTYNQLEATWTLLDGRAAAITGSAVVTSARSGASTARTQFVNYLNGLTPGGLTPGADSPVDRATYRARLEGYGNALTTLADALRVYVDARATAALDRIAVYENNGILDRTEKWSLVNDWQSLNREFEAVNLSYINQGLPPAVTSAQTAAFNALGPLGSPAGSLGAYLGGLTPSYIDSSVDTPLDRDTLSTRWQATKAAIEAFRVAMNAPRNADNTAAVVGNRLSQVDANGRGTSRRLNSMYALGGAQQVYIPTSGNTNVGGTIAANVPGSPVWAYHDGNGSTATIQVFPHLLIDDAGTLTFGGGFLFGAAFNAIYWIYDDSGYVSGNPTYGFTTNANDLNAPNRRLVGSVITPGPGTPAGAGVSGGGGGGGGIRERYYENQLTDIP